MQTKTIYFAGDLFDTKDLAGNVLLAQAVERLSQGSYRPKLPQDFEPREASPIGIRDTDLLELLTSDLAVFQFDGTDLDSGTVVEFVFAKCADIPSVLLRTDFRKNGDQEVDPWNLMTSFYPRTETLLFKAHALYRDARQQSGAPAPGATSEDSLAVIERVYQRVAQDLVLKLDHLAALPSLLPAADADTIFRWISRFPGFMEGPEKAFSMLSAALERRRQSLA
ncbi:MAG: nucleoside 2-deoxyribosyltransferase [Puniceicoccaceae bacterium]